MKSTVVAAALGLASLAAAAPQSLPGFPSGPFTTADYDDEPSAQAYVVPVGFGSIGVYEGLQYTGFFTVSNRNPTRRINGVIPQSDGQVAAGPPIPGVNNAVDVKYPNSPYEAFALTNFFFACAANNGAAFGSFAQPCTVEVTGFRDGEQVAQQNVSFVPQARTNTRMARAVLNPTFGRIDTATFDVVEAPPFPAGTVIYLDNTNYILQRA